MNAIVAFCKNLGIGKNGKLPWNVPDDLRHFYKLTNGNIVVMGGKTFSSLNSPLRNRTHYVLSRSLNPTDQRNVSFFRSDVELALKIREDLQNNKKVFLIGGSEIFANSTLMNMCTGLYATYINKEYDCDTFFDFYGTPWKLESHTQEEWCDNEEASYRFLYYKRGETYQEHKYLDLVKEVADKGNTKEDRTQVGTKSLFGKTLEFDIREGVPLFTHRRIAWKHCIEELLWFIRGSTDVKELQEKKVKIWDGNSTREFLDKQGLEHLEEGDIGPCFFRNAPVLTSSGYKPIQKVEKGDFVLSHLGNWKMVTKTMKRPYQKETITIKTDFLPAITATPDHPVLTNNDWKQAKDLTTNDYIGLKVDTHKIDFAKMNEKGWFLLGYIFYDAVISKTENTVSIKVKKEHVPSIEPLFKEVTKFYQDEKYEYPDFNVYFINSFFWVDLLQHFQINNGRYTKKIPEWIQNTSKENLTVFLDGFITSQNSDNPSLSITCETPDMAYSLFRIFIKCGKIVQLVQEEKHMTLYYSLLGQSDYFFVSGYVWMKVSSITQNKPTPTVEYVYNLEVDGDNSYTVSNQHVHNCYGFQWKHFGAKYVNAKTDYEGQGINQLNYILELLEKDPMSRRMVLSAWNPSDLKSMALAPCHYSAVFNVSFDNHQNHVLNCMVTLRSNDLILGCPFNVFSYCVLTHILALKKGMKPGKLLLTISDAHVYSDHLLAFEKFIYPNKDNLRPEPKLILDPSIKHKSLEEITIKDFDLVGYFPHPSLKLHMAV
jgi:thymidylate synthase